MSVATRRVVIADDEPLARERLRMLLAPHPEWTVVAECEHGGEAVDAILGEMPDLVFLDVRMPELDGLEVVEAIDARRAAGTRIPAIVFVTAHAEYALRAFEVWALDYLLKPVDAERLARTLARTAERLAVSGPALGVDAALKAFLEAMPDSRRHPRRFVVRDAHGAMYFVPIQDVDWIEARGNYVRLHAADRHHLLRDTMQGLESRLDPVQFVRVHRSAIVNAERIAKVEPAEHGEYTLTLIGGTTLRTSRSHSPRLRELLGV